MHTVFVYGTLMRGHRNHSLLDGRFVGAGWLGGASLYSLGSFPGLRLGGHDRVFGEVYEVTDRSLEALDRLEGVEAGFYARKRVTVELAGGRCVAAWVYEINEKNLRRATPMPGGSWNVHSLA